MDIYLELRAIVAALRTSPTSARWRGRMMIDMSPADVDRRLRQAARLEQAMAETPGRLAFRSELLQEAQRLRREQRVSMTPAAVDRRLREVAELLRLCTDLSRSRRLPPP